MEVQEASNESVNHGHCTNVISLTYKGPLYMLRSLLKGIQDLALYSATLRPLHFDGLRGLQEGYGKSLGPKYNHVVSSLQ